MSWTSADELRQHRPGAHRLSGDLLAPDVDAFNLEVQIKDQENTVSKAEKKLKDLQDDQESMEKKIKKLQDDLKENAKDQQNQQKEIEKQKQALESLRAKRKSA